MMRARDREVATWPRTRRRGSAKDSLDCRGGPSALMRGAKRSRKNTRRCPFQPACRARSEGEKGDWPCFVSHRLNLPARSSSVRKNTLGRTHVFKQIPTMVSSIDHMVQRTRVLAERRSLCGLKSADG